MMAKTPEELKRYYKDLSDEKLMEEYRYRMNIPTKHLGSAEIDVVMNTRRAVIELMKERGLL